MTCGSLEALRNAIIIGHPSPKPVELLIFLIMILVYVYVIRLCYTFMLYVYVIYVYVIRLCVLCLPSKVRVLDYARFCSGCVGAPLAPVLSSKSMFANLR